jgi:cell wall-associated NlpC family hydrolase
VFDRKNGWAWVQLDADGYVGYLREDVIGITWACPPISSACPAHLSIREPICAFRGARAVDGKPGAGHRHGRDQGNRLCDCSDDGTAMVAAHLRPLAETPNQDAVAVAAMFLETPYLWGGRSGFGIDCSGLVQMALAMTGKPAPRDSDQQANGLGQAIDPVQDGLRRGDLVFWKGHVGFLEDPAHAAACLGRHHVCDPGTASGDAIERIARLYGLPTGYRRP